MFAKNPFRITRINPANRINPIPDLPRVNHRINGLTVRGNSSRQIVNQRNRNQNLWIDAKKKLLTRIDPLTGSIPSRITRIVDFPDRARRAVDPATITQMIAKNSVKNG